jgi:hypothetical protein
MGSLLNLLILFRNRSRKALRNKRFLKGIIALLILANIIVFVSKVKRKRGRSPDDKF